MKLAKKLCSLLLAVMMVVVIIPVQAAAETTSRVTFLWPVKEQLTTASASEIAKMITTPYGYDPDMGRYHYAIDIGWKKTPNETLVAVANGVVAETGYTSSLGNYIALKLDETLDGKEIYVRYLHMRDKTTLTVGNKVKMGDTVGIMGKTGEAYGEHLDFRVSINKNYSKGSRYLSEADKAGHSKGDIIPKYEDPNIINPLDYSKIEYIPTPHVHKWLNTGMCETATCTVKYGDWVRNQGSDLYQRVKGTLTPASGSAIYIKQQPYKEPAGQYLAKVTSCEAVALLTNSIGNKWYEVIYTENGTAKTGYVYSGDVSFTKAPNNLEVKCSLASKFGGQITEGTSLWAKNGDYSGSVSSSDGVTNLTKVVFGIYNYSTGAATSSKNVVTKTNIGSPKYSITNADDTILFSSLSPGHYTFRIDGYADGTASSSASFDFYVVAKGSTTVSVTGVSLNKTSLVLNAGETGTLSATVSPSNATNKNVTWSSSNTAVASVSGGTVTAVGAGQATITAKTADGGKTAACTVTVTAPKTYAVRYDANGGTGAPATQNKVHDKALTLSTELPKYDGYVFKGWRDISPVEGTWTETKPSSGTYETGYLYYCYGYEHNNDMTYWYGSTKAGVESGAKKYLPSGTNYDANKLRYITYISSTNAGSSFKPANGGTFTANYTNPDGTTGTTQIKNTELYYKAPVYKQDGVSTITYQPGDTYTNNRDVTLVAMWEEAPATYTISYNANGGENAPDAQTKIQDVSLTLSSVEPQRDGYNFKGWATSSSATSAQYSAGSTYTANANVTLYAVWEAKTYTVQYDANGGTGAPDSQTETAGSKLTLSTTIPTRTNGKFMSWQDQNGDTYQPGTEITVESNLTLEAIWALKFVEDGQYVQLDESSYAAPGCIVNVPVLIKNFGNPTSVDLNATFIGHKDIGNNELSTEGAPEYIGYTPSSAIELREDGLLCVGTAQFKIPESATLGERFFILITDVDLTITDQYGELQVIQNGINVWDGSEAESNSLYRVYANTVPTYTIAYIANGGTGEPNDQTKSQGESVCLSTQIPTKEGYLFKGWIIRGILYAPGDEYTEDSDAWAFAVWEEKTSDSYTVSFNANGGSGTMNSVTGISGDYTLPANGFIAPEGKQFKGWATSPSGAVITGTSYNVTANTTFYAVWEEIPTSDSTTLQIGKAVSVRGKEVVIPISLTNNTGIASMNFKIEYDKTRLQLTGFENAQMTGWLVGVGTGEKAIWSDEKGSSAKGDILLLRFMVLDTAEDGLAEITVTGLDVVDIDEKDVPVTVVSGGIEVISRIPGDSNDDGNVSAADVLRLMKYLAGMEVEINPSNTDVTGDGRVSAADLLRLKKYFAGMDVVLE